MVEAVEHTPEWRASFLAAVDALEPIRDVYRLAGAYDFLLRIVVADMPAFDRFYEHLTGMVRLRGVNSLFALESVCATSASSKPRPSMPPSGPL
jgi:Lrp/AsnC family transcriptional regulator